ncbi:CaiB/BaiF CoA-transferase family protein [Pigmentiphaga soli]|uniref:CaiB/BaiF CoA-transferase family protein n=1 Tax=Pigmentiphaga soli TaxID=1007095 RepID=A0ABP8HNZ0_9BURK
MPSVLNGIRVVEQGTFITGPAAGMMLGDLGADVIKVEQPDAGDPFRAFRGGLYSPHFQAYNRNKRSIALDIRKDEDRAIFDDLIRSADVYIQNFRPGAADKLGAGEERLRALNPRLVYCSISGFGKTGPARQRPAYDTVAQAASGFLHLLVNPKNPRVVGPAIADAVTGFYAAYGVLGALYERERTGRGRSVDVSMLESMCHFNIDAFTHYFTIGDVMGPYSRPRASQSYVMECADGKWLALHMSSPPKFWESLAKAIGLPDLFDDPRFADRFARIDNYEDLTQTLAAEFIKRPRAEWCRLLEAGDVPHSPVQHTDEVLADEQVRHLQIATSARHPTMGEFRSVRSPVSYDADRTPLAEAPPTLDEHRQEILRELGRQ